MKSMTDNEILIAVFRNLQSWTWSVNHYFPLQREDMRVLIPILEQHIANHEPSDITDMAIKFKQNLKESLANPHCVSNKIDVTTGEMLQVVLGDFL